jgi:hypothetical protein
LEVFVMRILKMLLLALLFAAWAIPQAALSADELPVIQPRSVGKVKSSPEEYKEHFSGCSLACGLPWTTSASSCLAPQGEITFTAGNVNDGNPATAWCEGASGDGIGEWLELTFKRRSPGVEKNDSGVNVTGITMANGYHKNDATWSENNRVKTFRLELNGKPVALMKLKDTQCLQSFSNGPIETLKSGDKLRFVIVEVYRGSKYHDTCISDIILGGGH